MTLTKVLTLAQLKSKFRKFKSNLLFLVLGVFLIHSGPKFVFDDDDCKIILTRLGCKRCKTRRVAVNYLFVYFLFFVVCLLVFLFVYFVCLFCLQTNPNKAGLQALQDTQGGRKLFVCLFVFLVCLFFVYFVCKINLTSLGCKRCKTRKVAVNWSELVCSPPADNHHRSSPPGIRIKIGDKLRK